MTEPDVTCAEATENFDPHVTSNINDVKIRIYTPFQVRLASFLGGPIAAVYTLHQNYSRFENPVRAKQTLWFGIGFCLLLTAALPFLPDKFPQQILPLIYSLAAGAIANSYQLTKDSIKTSDKYARHSGWNVTVVTIISFICFCAVAFPFILLLDHFGVIQLA